MSAIDKLNSFNNGTIITEDKMRDYCPSIFAESAHESRSQKFKAIPTIEVLRALAKEGFFPVSIQQQGSRTIEQRNFSKHLVRMRRFDDSAKNLRVGDTIAEFVLRNANDGTAPYSIMGGLFRIACLNGMVRQSQDLGSTKVRHMLNDDTPRAIIDKVIAMTHSVYQHVEDVLIAPRMWSQVKLEEPQQYELARRSHAFMFRDIDGQVRTLVKPEQLLKVSRIADESNDLWTCFNRIQEKALRGGIEASTITHSAEYGTVETRSITKPITAIDRSLKLNTGLFDIAENFYKELTV